MRDLLLRLRRDFPAAVLPDPFRKMSEKISRRALDFRPILDDLFRPSPNRSSTNRLGSTITLDFDRLGASLFDVPASVHLKLDGTSQFLHLPTTGYLHSQRLGSPYLVALQSLTGVNPPSGHRVRLCRGGACSARRKLQSQSIRHSRIARRTPCGACCKSPYVQQPTQQKLSS